MSATSRPSSILVDADAISANVTALKDLVAPAELCAVVKADGYGHVGAVAAAAALAGGASRLAVAVAEEAVALRRAGIDAPILLLAEVVTAEGAALVIEHRLEATVYTSEGAELLAVTASGGVEVPVHLKIDTGMHRVGVAPERALALAGAIDAEPRLRLAGTCTHLAVADDPGRPETALQLERFDGVLEAMGAAGIDPGIRHAANSAGAILHPSARHDLVRCGIAIYGIHPSTASEGVVDLAAALELRSRVSHTIRVPAGDGVSYGLHGAVDHDRTVAVVPLGYADGVDRSLGRGAGRVLVGGCPRPIVGVVTMDQFMVECGDDPVARGDEVVLLGVQGEASITAADWARWIGTIPYEVVARLGPRVPRIVRS